MFDGAARPAFYGLPGTAAPGEKSSPSVVPLYEYKDGSGRHWYSPDGTARIVTATRSEYPICRVWHNPSTVLALDYETKP